MANQAQPTRPWLSRLASMRPGVPAAAAAPPPASSPPPEVRPQAQAQAQPQPQSQPQPQPQPQAQPQPQPQPQPQLQPPAARPIIRPAFGQGFRPAAQPQQPQPQPPLPPPSTMVAPPFRLGSISVPSSPVQRTTASLTSSPVVQKQYGTYSVPTSPVVQKQSGMASVPTSPVVQKVIASSSSVPTSPKPSASSSSVPTSPNPKVIISTIPQATATSTTSTTSTATVVTESVTVTAPAPPPEPVLAPPAVSRLASLRRAANPTPTPAAAPAPAPALAPAPAPALITQLLNLSAQRTPPAEKVKPTAPPPSPLTLPPAQAKSAPEPIEQKTVVIEKPMSTFKPSNDGDDTRKPSIFGTDNEKRESGTKDRKGTLKKADSEDASMKVITLAGDNIGAVMELTTSRKKPDPAEGKKTNPKSWWGTKLGSDSSSSDEEKSKKKDGAPNKLGTPSAPMNAFMNSNVQAVNNSILLNTSCNHHDPGVHVFFTRRGGGRGLHLKDSGEGRDK